MIRTDWLRRAKICAHNLVRWSVPSLWLIACVGCGQWLPEMVPFGAVKSPDMNRSLNGLGVHRKMWEAAGAKCLTPQKLSPKLDSMDVVVLVGQTHAPPGKLARSWLERWLGRDQGRTVIYFGRDFNAESYFRHRTLDQLPTVDQPRAQILLAMNEASELNSRLKHTPEWTYCGWFFLDPEKSRLEIESFQGPWKEGAESDLDSAVGYWPVRSLLVPPDSAEYRRRKPDWNKRAKARSNRQSANPVPVAIPGTTNENQDAKPQGEVAAPEELQELSDLVEDLDNSSQAEPSERSPDPEADAGDQERTADTDQADEPVEVANFTNEQPDDGILERSTWSLDEISTQEAWNLELRQALDSEVLLAAESGEALIFRLTSNRFPGSQILIVNNGAPLLNGSLVDPLHQQIGERLVETCLPADRVALISYEANGLLISSIEEKDTKAAGLEMLTVWPISGITMPAALLGIVVCAALLPILGRPQSLKQRSVSDFGLHVEAIGHMLHETGDKRYARATLGEYFRKVRDEVPPAWLQEDEPTDRRVPISDEGAIKNQSSTAVMPSNPTANSNNVPILPSAPSEIAQIEMSKLNEEVIEAEIVVEQKVVDQKVDASELEDPNANSILPSPDVTSKNPQSRIDQSD